MSLHRKGAGPRVWIFWGIYPSPYFRLLRKVLSPPRVRMSRVESIHHRYCPPHYKPHYNTAAVAIRHHHLGPSFHPCVAGGKAGVLFPQRQLTVVIALFLSAVASPEPFPFAFEYCRLWFFGRSSRKNPPTCVEKGNSTYDTFKQSIDGQKRPSTLWLSSVNSFGCRLRTFNGSTTIRTTSGSYVVESIESVLRDDLAVAIQRSAVFVAP